MGKKKSLRTRGKLKLSRYFQQLNNGEAVAVKKEVSIKSSFPDRIQGRTGIIEGPKGKTYVVKIKDQNKEKRYLIEPIHLKKIKQIKK